MRIRLAALMAAIALLGVGVFPAAATTPVPSPPRVSIGDAAVVEGHNDSRKLRFTVSLSRPADAKVWVHFHAQAGTANEGADFSPVSSGVAFSPGETSRAAHVWVRGDASVEPNETFTVKLFDLSGPAVLGRSTATGTILDDDPPPWPRRVAIGNASTVEGHSGARTIFLTVTLSAMTSQPVTVDYRTRPWSAGAGDFVARSGTVEIPAAYTNIGVHIPIVPDSIDEPNERFTVVLSNAHGAVLGRSTGIGVILDDD
jgi:hypothetical protein